MSNLVIVAIPREDDLVWKVSSEKVPHLTLLFLGEAEGKPVEQIAEFIGHAVRFGSISRFGLDVDRRGELGEDKADVLFFEDRWQLPRVRDFRAMLLKDNNIKKAYDSVEQFPLWNPHLTLGYPETPAKKVPDYHGFYWVQFDKIALWDGDSEGVEFPLKDDYYPEVGMDMAMADTAAAGRQFLAHFGVKGMRWGVRNNRPSRLRETTAVTTREHQTVALGKTKVKALGGVAQPAHNDAVKAAVQKQKFKKSGAAALSNQELRELANRIQLENQVAVLASSKGKKFVKSELESQAKQGAQKGIREGIKNVGIKKVAKAGAVAAI